jgi:hypothetical protein
MSGISSPSGIGVGQTWQSVSRSSGTTYYNTTGKPIMIAALIWNTAADGSVYGYMTVDGITLMQVSVDSQGNASPTFGLSAIVPPNSSYSCYSTYSLALTELR